MRYWFDTEFIEDGKTIDLISIGMVAEDGRELYLLNWECDLTRASLWVKENVLFQLPLKPTHEPSIGGTWLKKQDIVTEIKDFVFSAGLDTKPEFWAYYADYDWVVFCQLFGTMMDLPDSFPMYCLDIKQECDRLGNPKLPELGEGMHNALEDARWNKRAWEFLRDLTI